MSVVGWLGDDGASSADAEACCEVADDRRLWADDDAVRPSEGIEK